MYYEMKNVPNKNHEAFKNFSSNEIKYFNSIKLKEKKSQNTKLYILLKDKRT